MAPHEMPVLPDVLFQLFKSEEIFRSEQVTVLEAEDIFREAKERALDKHRR